MKHYSTPAIVLIAITALMLFAILKSYGRTRQAATNLATNQAAVVRAQRELASAQAASIGARKKSAPVDRFLGTWTEELAAEANIEQIFGRLDTLAVDNLLSPSGKNFTLNKNYFFNGKHLPVQSINITVAGDYARTLNWLGAVENAFPLARVEQVSYVSNGNSLSLVAQFVFPRDFAE